MKTLGNIIWVIFGGFFIAVEYFLASIVLMVTIIGIPFGIQTMKLALVALWPFGVNVTTSEHNSGCVSTIMNVLWILTGGIWIAISHVLFGLFFTFTIIGIPFGKQHFKLAGLALTPFGKVID
jgi:uncharacterized membrane protein YccF (DUF307 family)